MKFNHFRNINWTRQFIDLLEKLGLPYYICSKLFDLHYKHINKRIYPWFNLAYITLDQNYDYESFGNKCIWVFWWQGYNDMPLITKKCFNSIIKHSLNHEVILLTKYNINQYIKLPYYIYKKLNDGYITFTEFSDILRFSLLNKYGGLWIDSTVYCTSNLPPECFHNKIFTLSGGYTKYHSNVSLGKWTSFMIGGDAGEPLFEFMDKILMLYWKYNNYLIDYFLTDFALKYAYDNNIGGFKDYDDTITPDPNIFKLEKLLNKPYNKKLYNKLINHTGIFKLTYKEKFKENRKTFYHVIMNN